MACIPSQKLAPHPPTEWRVQQILDHVRGRRMYFSRMALAAVLVSPVGACLAA
jgi:hypothetical protein